MKMTHVLTAVALATALSVPALAMETPQGAAPAHDAKCKKECAMLARNCRVEVDSLQQRIEKLQTTIKNNAGSYSEEELRTLRNELEETMKTLVDLQEGGA